MKTLRIFVSGIFLAATLSSCSVSSVGTTEAASGAVIGAAAGTGIGYLIGEEIGKKTENMILAGTIGAGIGILGGALIHEYLRSRATKRTVVVRQSRAIDENQKKIDALRNLQYEQSIWGQKETKPWDQRYWDSADYEGGEYEGHLSH